MELKQLHSIGKTSLLAQGLLDLNEKEFTFILYFFRERSFYGQMIIVLVENWHGFKRFLSKHIVLVLSHILDIYAKKIHAKEVFVDFFCHNCLWIVLHCSHKCINRVLKIKLILAIAPLSNTRLIKLTIQICFYCFKQWRHHYLWEIVIMVPLFCKWHVNIEYPFLSYMCKSTGNVEEIQRILRFSLLFIPKLSDRYKPLHVYYYVYCFNLSFLYIVTLDQIANAAKTITKIYFVSVHPESNNSVSELNYTKNLSEPYHTCCKYFLNFDP